jgi:hypothetical protein
VIVVGILAAAVSLVLTAGVASGMGRRAGFRRGYDEGIRAQSRKSKSRQVEGQQTKRYLTDEKHI